MRLNFKLSIGILVGAPFLVVLYLAFTEVQSFSARIENKEQGVIAQQSSVYHSQIIHELQKERDYVLLYLAAPLLDKQMQLEEQWLLTDDVYTQVFNNQIHYFKDSLNWKLDLDQFRNDITWFNVDKVEAEAFYHNLIDQLLSAIRSKNQQFNLASIEDTKVAYLALLQSKESLARIRGDVMQLLNDMDFSKFNYGSFAKNKGAFEAGLKEFVNYVPTDILERFDRDFYSGNTSRTLDVINELFNFQEANIYFYTPEEWWLGVTGSINSLHESEKLISRDISHQVDQEVAFLRDEIVRVYLKLMLLLSVLIVLWFWVIRSLSSRLKQIQSKALKLSKGNPDGEIIVQQEDDIGKLSLVFNQLSKSAQKFAQNAIAIGEGNYETHIEIRSEHDLLGSALVQMRDTLKVSQAQLHKQYTQLQQAYQHKSDFLANISHELRTPLNAVLILAQLLQESKSISVEEKDFAKKIFHAGNSLLNMINDILDSSKLESGMQQLKLSRFTLKDLIDELTGVFVPLAQAKNIQLSINCKDETLELHTDFSKLAQIINNLLANAIKFSPNSTKVTCVFEVKEAYLQINIEDEGIGIPEKDLVNIFTPFYQVDSSLQRKYDGTGLGLSIVKALVTLLNGKIKVNSVLNQGTTFTVVIQLRLPQKNVSVSEVENIPQTSFSLFEENQPHSISQSSSKEGIGVNLSDDILARSKNKHIIVYHYDVTMAFTVATLLEGQAAKIFIASEEEEKLAIITANHVDYLLIFTQGDWRLTQDLRCL